MIPQLENSTSELILNRMHKIILNSIFNYLEGGGNPFQTIWVCAIICGCTAGSDMLEDRFCCSPHHSEHLIREYLCSSHAACALQVCENISVLPDI